MHRAEHIIAQCVNIIDHDGGKGHVHTCKDDQRTGASIDQAAQPWSSIKQPFECIAKVNAQVVANGSNNTDGKQAGNNKRYDRHHNHAQILDRVFLHPFVDITHDPHGAQDGQHCTAIFYAGDREAQHTDAVSCIVEDGRVHI